MRNHPTVVRIDVGPTRQVEAKVSYGRLLQTFISFCMTNRSHGGFHLEGHILASNFTYIFTMLMLCLCASWKARASFDILHK